MKVDNDIEAVYRELKPNIDTEYRELYFSFQHEELVLVLSTLHSKIVEQYSIMNQRLPTRNETAYFWAPNSRELLKAIDTSFALQKKFEGTAYAFTINTYYYETMSKSLEFLNSHGSSIPENTSKIDLFYKMPIFEIRNSIVLHDISRERRVSLIHIGTGSYANVYKYKDEYYQRYFVVKRAKKELDIKELERFRREYEQMRELNSPYVVEVFKFDEANNEYTMEFLDCTMENYINNRNSTISSRERIVLTKQVLRAFVYINAKGILHRDISPKNVLIKLYDDVKVVKISDFGLVKIPDSDLTSLLTEVKGYFNDPALHQVGFDKYNIIHETYALTKLVYFIHTGKTKLDVENIKDPNLQGFIDKGLSANNNLRYQTVQELESAYISLWS